MKKIYITSVVIIIIIVGGFLVKNSLWQISSNDSTTETNSEIPTGTNETASSSTNLMTTSYGAAATSTKPVVIPPIVHSTWIVFQKYLEFAKNHNLEGIKSLSYQISATCKDSKQKTACDALMDNAYEVGKTLKESDYTNFWSDSKQIILYTKPVRQESGDVVAYLQGFMYFTKDTAGNLLVLGLRPNKIYAVTKKDYPGVQAEARLEVMMKDSDQDGLTDEEEKCQTPDRSQGGCTMTDPALRDTNNDGWWDGIADLFYKK